METQTALPQILAHEVGRLKRVEFLEARLQTRPFCSFETCHRSSRQTRIARTVSCFFVTDTLGSYTWLRSIQHKRANTVFQPHRQNGLNTVFRFHRQSGVNTKNGPHRENSAPPAAERRIPARRFAGAAPAYRERVRELREEGATPVSDVSRGRTGPLRRRGKLFASNLADEDRLVYKASSSRRGQKGGFGSRISEALS
jgi:hypothetical protein